MKVLFLTIAYLLAAGGLATGGKWNSHLGWRNVRAFERSTVDLGGPVKRVWWERPDHAMTELELEADKRSARLPEYVTGSVVLYRQFEEDPDPTDDPLPRSREWRVSLIHPGWGWAAGAATVVFFLVLLLMVARPDPPEDKELGAERTKGLLTVLWEERGGLSLARFQLLIWFAVAIFVLAALSIPLLELPPLSGPLAVLFALSGLTMALGVASSPDEKQTDERNETDGKKAEAGKEKEKQASKSKSEGTAEKDSKAMTVHLKMESEESPTHAHYELDLSARPDKEHGTGPNKDPSPSARQLVEDWGGQLDMSRVQQLVVVLVGAASLFLAFVTTMRVPVIPEGLLGLLGGSQAAYLATKGVKQAKGVEADTK